MENIGVCVMENTAVYVMATIAVCSCIMENTAVCIMENIAVYNGKGPGVSETFFFLRHFFGILKKNKSAFKF